MGSIHSFRSIPVLRFLILECAEMENMQYHSRENPTEEGLGGAYVSVAVSRFGFFWRKIYVRLDSEDIRSDNLCVILRYLLPY